jgi:hypothetical protein
MAKAIKIELKHPTPPDSCERCPLIGIIPEEHRQTGVRQSYCCLGVYPHEPLTSKGIKVSVSGKREKTGHIHHRPCEDRWDTWWENPGHMVTISKESYRFCRLPYESRQQLAFNFKTRKPRKQ